MATPSVLLTNASAVREYGGHGANVSDALLGPFISAASAWVEHHCGRNFLIDDYVEQFHVAPAQRIFALPAYPIVSVAAVENDSEWDFGTPLSSDYYHADAETGVIYVRWPLIEGLRALRVSWNGGLAASTAAVISSHGALHHAATMLVDSMWRRHQDLLANTQVTEGTTIQAVNDAKVPPTVREMLRPYRAREMLV